MAGAKNPGGFDSPGRRIGGSRHDGSPNSREVDRRKMAEAAQARMQSQLDEQAAQKRRIAGNRAAATKTAFKGPAPDAEAQIFIQLIEEEAARNIETLEEAAKAKNASERAAKSAREWADAAKASHDKQQRRRRQIVALANASRHEALAKETETHLQEKLKRLQI